MPEATPLVTVAVATTVPPVTVAVATSTPTVEPLAAVAPAAQPGSVVLSGSDDRSDDGVGRPVVFAGAVGLALLTCVVADRFARRPS